jgi:hypothetical protein
MVEDGGGRIEEDGWRREDEGWRRMDGGGKMKDGGGWKIFLNILQIAYMHKMIRA